MHDSSDISVTLGLKMWAVRFVSWLSAALGLGTFMGFVNTLIGVMSACWLAVQIYGYIRYELPLKRLRRDRLLQRRAEDADPPCDTEGVPL